MGQPTTTGGQETIRTELLTGRDGGRSGGGVESELVNDCGYLGCLETVWLLTKTEPTGSVAGQNSRTFHRIDCTAMLLVCPPLLAPYQPNTHNNPIRKHIRRLAPLLCLVFCLSDELGLDSVRACKLDTILVTDQASRHTHVPLSCGADILDSPQPAVCTPAVHLPEHSTTACPLVQLARREAWGYFLKFLPVRETARTA